ncbi:MAG: hypothetical protein RI897_3267 [Verrucomicrobiota bacterium]
MDTFHDESEEGGAPADEDGGGVEVGDGRATFEDHAIEEAAAMDEDTDEEEPYGGAAEVFG